MAGKTFPGIGELEDESPPADPADPADSGESESRPFYSGPTVVDDLKVEEGLKKLRSLDAPLEPPTGIGKAVVDAIESGPSHSSAQVVSNQVRETAVGRNVIGPTVGQQEIPPPFDDRALRGTLFGHSIHAPEFALPSPEEPPPPGALALFNRGAPTKTVAIFPPNRPQDGVPFEAEPFQRSDRYRNTPLTPIAVSKAGSRKKVFTRVAIGAAGILAIVAAALFWARPGDDSDGSAAAAAASAAVANKPPVPQPAVATPSGTAPPAEAPPAAAEPPVPAPPVAAAREAEPEPMPPIPPVHAPPSVTRAVARHPADPSEAEPEAEAAGPETHSHHSHAASGHADRRHAAAPQPDKTDTEAPPAKAPHKRATEDDPDATMAPSIE
jgi:hypothetical protein